MKPRNFTVKTAFSRLLAVACGLLVGMQSALAGLSLPNSPLFISLVTEPPLVLLTMGRDHKLFYEAYNDVSDLDQDGNIDVGYKPNDIDYFGYFDSFKCYEYDNTSTDVFRPTSTTTDKTCAGALEWSGDFLNYVTTARMDAIRKVLYGGYRSLDTDSATYLERTHVPQDAHSWGKEYNGLSEGYDIRDYSPLSLPPVGKRHLFANTSLNISGDDDVYEPPLMRVLTNSSFRVWDWLSIERPVADSQCGIPKQNCVPSTGGPSNKFSIIPASATDGTSNVSLQLYDIRNYDASPICDYGSDQARCVGARSESEMDKVEQFGINASAVFPATPNSPFAIDTANNVDFPNTDIYSQTDDYLLYITGTLNISSAGDYEFAVDGDDAVDLHIDLNNNFSFADANEDVAFYYGLHGFDGSVDSAPSNASTPFKTTTITLTPGSYRFRIRLTERGGGAGVKLYWAPPGGAGISILADFEVRTEVCVAGLLEENCLLYPDGNYKPTGILHDFGGDDEMKFGLLTGSYTNNLSGGVMRKLMGTFTDEYDADDGTYNSTVGIVKTIDRLREIGFNTSETHNSNCGFIFNKPITERGNNGNGICRWWGNPIAEMMYEGLRYFAGKASPTSEFNYTSGGDDADLGLPLPTWDDPYDTSTGGSENCAIPLQLVISDINPSYDSDELPGVNSNFLRRSLSDALSGIDVETLAKGISTFEDANNDTGDDDISGSHFIGQLNGDIDFAPTPKDITHLGEIRGLAPEEPSKEGSYYSASVAAFGKQNDIHPIADGDQNVQTVAVAIASPLPKFEIPIRDGQIITLVPFAKSVGGASVPGGDGTSGEFKPTNTIVDFYVDTIVNTNTDNIDSSINGGLPYYKFRINYEDAEQGADHDMDAIAIYEIQVNDNGTPTDKSDDLLQIGLISEYAAGSVKQHMGYIISGTTSDGIYLEIRDADTGSGSDVDYFLDTPDTSDNDASFADGTFLPLNTTASPRTFTPGTDDAATLLNDPLWYAAKWGGFIDEEPDIADATYVPEPDKDSEWDDDGDGVPDSYFLVTNAGTLQDQLRKAFERITELTGASASSVAINSTVLRSTSRLYQATFSTGNWEGELTAYTLTESAELDTVAWTANTQLDSQGASGRNIFTMIERSGTDTPIEFLQPPTSGDNTDLATALEAGATGQLVDELTVGNIDGVDIINYLRGDQSKEQSETNGVFRNRSVLLGDIVGGSPVSMGADNFQYDNLPDDPVDPNDEASTYNAYVNTKFNRFTDASNNEFSVIFTSSNDGMIHAFQDTTDTTGIGPAGQEVFAYVPKVLHSSIATFADPFYQHRFFADASPSVFDAFVDTGSGSKQWATLLSGTLGLGERAMYALNVSDPLNFDVDDILWEIDSSDFPQMGYITHSTAIVRLQNGRWGVVVGNGFNSDNQTAQLLIFDAEDGSLIKAIDTGVGSGGSPNGLSQPFILDEDGDRIADFVYAGDLLGNLWKFDISNVNDGLWAIYNESSGGSSKVPLFTAVDGSGDTQPITTRPVVVKNTAAGGYVILFGTGKYLETGDNIIPSSPQVQSFYGIHDDQSTLEATSGRTRLYEQLITEEIDIFLADDPDTVEDESLTLISRARLTTEDRFDYTSYDGWFVDLATPVEISGGTTYEALGERVIANPLSRFERVTFVTFTPAGSCENGGTSIIMQLDAVFGARLQNSVFDFNDDGVIDSSDFISDSGGIKVGGSGIYIPATLAPPAVIMSNDGGTDNLLTSTLEGGTNTTASDADAKRLGRQSWKQLD